jgi:hypothetical protein
MDSVTAMNDDKFKEGDDVIVEIPFLTKLQGTVIFFFKTGLWSWVPREVRVFQKNGGHSWAHMPETYIVYDPNDKRRAMWFVKAKCMRLKNE